MTILQELAVLYERRAEDEDWPKPGFSKEKIGAFVLLDNKGSVRDIRSLMAPDDKDKLRPRLMSVPNPVKRTSGITPNTLWDKSAYVLGITETESGPGQKKRTLDEHAEFKRKHLALLECADDKELIAFRNFCYSWTPAQFVNFPDAIPLVDQNMVFMLDDGSYLHELPAARTLLRKNDLGEKVCLVTGQKGSVARLHPSIKGVMDAQPTGASLVSFNKPADTSHGMKQGDNAPVSEEAAFAYSTALNAMLARGSGNSVNVGDDTVVFWADKPEVEWTIDALLSGVDDSAAEVELRAQVKAIAEGKLRANEPLDPNTRMFVLGLTPNSARLSVRYWYPGTLRGFAMAITEFWSDCVIKPSPFERDGRDVLPKPRAFLSDLAVQGNTKNISSRLGGDLMRAILTHGRYPATMLYSVIARIRVEGEPERKNRRVDGRRAALISAVLRRNYKQEVPMALDEMATDAAYLLGRLFGAYAYAEKSYQDRGAGLRQKYLAAASATPARIFPVLMRGYEHNLASLRKAGGLKAGVGVKADQAVSAIIARLPGNRELPVALPLEEQGRFFVGFYHQFSAFYTKADNASDTNKNGGNS